MVSFAWNKSITLLISIIATSSSYCSEAQNEPSSSARKWVLQDSEHFGIASISVIDKCPSNDTDDEVKRKCENFHLVDLFVDTFLFRPVTDEWENVTYRNIYCAKCNRKNLDVGHLKFWTLLAYHRNESAPNSSFVSDVNVAVRDNIRVDKNTKQLISNIRGSNRKVFPLLHLPTVLNNSSYEVFSPDPNEIIEFFTDLNTEKLAPVPEEFNCSGKKFCSSKPQPQTCLYFDLKGTNCPENEIFVEKLDFIYDESRVIINDGRTFDSDVYFNSTEGAEVILVCGLKADESCWMRIRRNLIDFSRYFSTFLLLVYLVAKTYKKDFQNFIKLVEYLYCVVLLAVYLYQLFNIYMPGPLIIRTYIMAYVYLCHALWAVLISYEYWRCFSASAKGKPYELQLNQARKTRSSFVLKQRIYGFIGWVVPGLLLCLVYPFLTKEDKSAVCPQFPSHYRDGFAEYLSNFANNLFVILLIFHFIIFLVLIPVMALQGYNFIVLATRRSIAQNAKNPSELDYLLFFTRVAYLMGFNWMLICITLIVEAIFGNVTNISQLFNTIGSVLLALHGTFIFFVYGYEDIRATYKRTRKISFKTQSTDMRPQPN